MEECPICIEKFTPTVRRKVSCNYCDYTVCIGCTQRYILDLEEDPKCMSCNKQWTEAFILDTFTKAFRFGDYKKHREHLLFERERGMFPAAQIIIEKTKDVDAEIEIFRKQYQELTIAKKKMDEEYNIATNKYLNAKNKKERILNGNFKDIKAERREFIRPCPGENCKGFLSTQWKCGLCDIRVCADCFEVKFDPKSEEETKDDHTCNEDALKTAEEIRASCKGCPKCGVMIFKISGCDMMFCVQCHIAFSWRTGQIQTGQIHNPHYYEWQRQLNNGVVAREPGDNPFGCNENELPRVSIILRILRESRCPEVLTRSIISFHQIVSHYRHYERQRFRVQNLHERNIDLRLQYLKNQITEEAMRIQLQRREKANQKKAEIGNLIDMFVNVSKDLFHGLIQQRNYEEFVVQARELIQYYNRSSTDISSRFNCKTHPIHDMFTNQ